MKALTVFFPTDKKWEIMLEVFRRSWEYSMDIPLEVVQENPPQKSGKIWGVETNTRKLQLWQKYFTEDIIFCDCDMLVRGDITEGFQKIKDIGYTERTDGKLPLNAGVVFARYSNYSKRFLEEWERINQRMYEDPKFHKPWNEKYAGINQAALGWMLENGWTADVLPESYNMCIPSRWKEGKMVHIKSGAREICFTRRPRRLRGSDKALHQLFWQFSEVKNYRGG